MKKERKVMVYKKKVSGFGSLGKYWQKAKQKGDKEMKRILILVGVMVMGCLVSSSAMAGLGAGLSLGYFNPKYGEINDALTEINEMIEETPGVESDLGFGGGLAWTIGLDYDVNPNWVIKGEYLNFSPETSGSYSYGGEEYGYKVEQSINIRTNLRALILSGIYRFSPGKTLCPYAGVGVGSFSTKVEIKAEGEYSYYDYYYDEWVTETLDESIPDEASSIGFQLLGGAEYKIGKQLSVVGELRYISAKAEGFLEEDEMGIGEESIDIDWSGFSIGLGARYRF